MDRSSFEASLRARARQRDLGGHPTPGELALYHAGQMTDEEEGQIQDHLTVCEECARLLLSLSEFEQHRPEPEAAGEDPSAAAWLRFRDRLREEEAAEAPAPEEEPKTVVQPLQRRRMPVWQRPVVAWAVAAGLAVCVVGLGLRVGSLQEENRRLLVSPSVIPVLDLVVDVQRGAGDQVREATGNNPLILLHLDTDPSVAEYEVDVVSASGETVVSAERLVPDQEDGSLRLDLTRRPLTSGDYVVRVHDPIEGRPLIVELPFRIP